MQRGPQRAGRFCRPPFPERLAPGPSHVWGKYRGGGEGGVWVGALCTQLPQLSAGTRPGPRAAHAHGEGAGPGKEEGRGQEVVHPGSGGPPRKENQFSTGLSFHVASYHPHLPSSIRKWEGRIPKFARSSGTTCTSWTCWVLESGCADDSGLTVTRSPGTVG